MAELLMAVAADDRSFPTELFSRDRSANPHHVVLLEAKADRQVVSTGRLHFESTSEFASLWSGSTLPAWRGRGIYRALVAYRAGLAAGRGYQYLPADATENSQPVVERLGFLPVSTTTPYLCSPSA